MAALSKIRAAGFGVSLAGDCFEITPASALTPNQREFLKQHKVEIVNELRSETSGLATSDHQKLLDYLVAIGETDQEMINELLTECGKDAALLDRQLQQAYVCLQIERGDYSGLVQCSGCSHLVGDACNQRHCRLVVEKWRKCVDHATKIITCKSCDHEGFPFDPDRACSAIT